MIIMIIINIIAHNFPLVDLASISPYPTVDKVTITKYRYS